MAANGDDPGATNWGSRLEKRIAIFGLPRLLKDALAECLPRSHLDGASVSGAILGISGPDRDPDRVSPEVNEITGSDQPNRGEGELRRDEHGRQAEARGERPAPLPDRDTHRGGDAGRPAAEERVPDRQGGVLTRRHDDDGRNSDERSE